MYRGCLPNCMSITLDTIACTEQELILLLMDTSIGLMIPLKTQKYCSPGSIGGGEKYKLI